MSLFFESTFLEVAGQGIFPVLKIKYYFYKLYTYVHGLFFVEKFTQKLKKWKCTLRGDLQNCACAMQWVVMLWVFNAASPWCSAVWRKWNVLLKGSVVMELALTFLEVLHATVILVLKSPPWCKSVWISMNVNGPRDCVEAENVLILRDYFIVNVLQDWNWLQMAKIAKWVFEMFVGNFKIVVFIITDGTYFEV